MLHLKVGRAAAALCVVATLMLVSACSATPSGVAGTPVPAPLTDYERLELAVANDFGTLLDHQGLVANPFDEATLPLDIYGTALLSRASRALGLGNLTVHPSAITARQIDAYRTGSGIPDSWLAFSLATVGVSDRAYPLAPRDNAGSAAADVNGQAADLWAWSFSDASPKQTTLRQRIARTINSPGLDVVALDSLIDICERRSLSCPRRTRSIHGSAGLDGARQILQTRATLRLLDRGVSVTGVKPLDRKDLADTAEQLIASAPGGYEVEVSALAEIAFQTDHRRRAFEDYLRRSETRKDSRTGLLHTYAEAQGTIANTYSAAGAVGQYWPIFLKKKAVLRAVSKYLAASGLGSGGVGQLQALYLKRLFVPLDAKDRNHIDAALRVCGDSRQPVDRRIALAQILAMLDRDECHPRVADVTSLHSAPEGEQIAVIGAAQQQTVQNSEEVLASFRSYLRTLPVRVLHGDVNDPLFLGRVTLLANGEDVLTGSQWDQVSRLLRSRKGCAATPHLIRASTNRHSVCGVQQTEVAMNIGVSY